MGSYSIQYPPYQAQEPVIKRIKLCSSPQYPLHLKYITAIESACQKLDHQDTEELRPDINGLLRKSHAPKPNLIKGEIKALAELRKDNNRTVLTANRKDYTDKANNLLVQPKIIQYRSTAPRYDSSYMFLCNNPCLQCHWWWSMNQ